eukprot:scaffold13658_cov75-Cyclotella_meneghiniana.AAC.5
MPALPVAVSGASIQPPQRSKSRPRLLTSEPTMPRRDISPPSGRIEAREATPTHTTHTTINRDAGGGMRGG